ncbi:TonB-dependent receptor [candidate division KSB1 bacterium]|nr:TonB-dependent receptor [candidate division KSB1 bacterium]
MKQTFRFEEKNHVTTGFSFSRDEVTGTNIVGRPVRDNLSFFIQNQIKFPSVPAFFEYATLYPALRVDYFSKFGSEVSPKLGLLLGDLLMSNLNLKANVGRSFRVPSFNSLFFVSSVQVRSNPDLSPERAFEFDLGLNFRMPESKWGVPEFAFAYYRRNVDGSILWLPDFRFIWRPRNISRVIAQGVEATASWQSADEKVRLNFNYTFTDARFDLPGNSNPVPYRPEHQLNLEVGVNLAGIEVNAHQHWVSKRFPNVAGTNAIPGYALTDINFSTRMEVGKFKLAPKFVITNLFAEDYQVVSNFPMPGREFRISLVTNY